ncbi:restriction endonuclease subunit S [Halarcobacter sp.]|uniref:restriction endonuclease subunit S n=1 Tax=Halarcobacter sp. TaxID=2321133 RepID=UPI003B0066E7
MKNGWKQETLGEIGKVSMCKRILKKQTNNISGIPFYKIGTFGKEANAFISEEIYNEFKEKYSFPKKGDILLSASGTIGRRVIYDGEPAYFQDSNIVWIDNDEKKVLNEYLYKFYGFCDWNPSRGATISRLYNDDLRRIKVAFPIRLDEQKQIVETLDKAFEAIDKAKENIEKNIQNSKELFQSKLNEIFSQKGEGWEEKTLKEVCSIITDGTHQTPKYFDSGYTFLSSKNVTSGVIDWDNIKYIDKEQHIQMQKRVSPQLNDVLLAKNGTTGVAAIVDREVDFDIYVSLALLRATEKLKPRYLLHFVNSSTAKAQFNKRLKGVGVPNLHLKEIREVIINYPIDKNEQKKIVEYIDDLTYIRNGLVDNYQQKLKNIEELKKSILQKAFSGELI